MSSNVGTATFPAGTGSKTLGIGMAATWMEIHFKGSTIKPSDGYIYGTSQYCYSDPAAGVVPSKAIQVLDTSGTVVLEGTFTGFSGNNATFNITTIPSISIPQMLVVFGN